MLQIFDTARTLPKKIAIVEGEKSYSYQALLEKSQAIASFLLNEKKDLDQDRVAFMISPGFDYISFQWGIWMAGGIAVPLYALHTPFLPFNM
jgi:malonyl-CoA/methylmalonyl-CoA synthetase